MSSSRLGYGVARFDALLSFARKRSMLTKAGSGADRGAPSSAYVHLPFCKRRCFYCDFPIQVVGSNPGASHVKDYISEYADVLCKEIESTGEKNTAKLSTVFFGGGTPSLTPPETLAKILAVLEKVIGIDSEAEISMEVDPGTFDLDKLRAYKNLGVNRFSMGVQSFHDDQLKKCGRSHALRDVYQAIEDILSIGPKSWSLDLISGLPHLNIDTWSHTLSETIRANPDHVSVYDLQIEESTPFARWYTPGVAPLPTNDAGAEMYALASDKLRSAGFEHYEVSNYAKPGHRCVHNMSYWSMVPFHAFGLGAASYLNGQRFHRPKKMKEYVDWVQGLPAKGGVGMLGTTSAETEEDRLLDMIMLRFRLKDGLDLAVLEGGFGGDVRENVCGALGKFVAEGFVEKVDGGGGVLSCDEDWSKVDSVRLHDPKGFLVSNDVISEIFASVS
ncbi:hypothetical protein BSKO_05994 [Bryopsis sp. KO-2023]|nr:hypothetical protein BSKO_05994 [Bryopsis sp. KO-2023]